MRKPNVIFILADDMGYGDFSAFNPALDSTRALDRLVAEGVTLSNCHASSPVCAPARASIMTGKYPQRCGVIDTLEARGLDRLKLSETTVGEIFKQNGYATALIGKWHLGAIDPQYHPVRRGFDHFVGFRGGWNYYYDYTYERGEQRVDGDGTYMTDLWSDEAVSYIHAHASEPFFMHLAYNAPHFPLEAPAGLIAKYKAQGLYTDAVCRVYAMLESMDAGIQRILDELDVLSIADDTIVVFTSDNGPDFGGSGDDCMVRFNCDLKGSKMHVYEGGIKVPAVVRWPKELPAGLMTDELVHGTDWVPTLMSLCGIEHTCSSDFDGSDVSSAFHGKPLPNRTLFWQWNRYHPNIACNAAARDSQYKLVHTPVASYLDLPDWEVDMDVDIKRHPLAYTDISPKPYPTLPELTKPTIELYAIGTDPREEHDLSKEKPEQVVRLERDLHAWFAQMEWERL